MKQNVKKSKIIISIGINIDIDIIEGSLILRQE